MRRTWKSAADERGQVLPIALLFLSFGAIVVTAILHLAFTNASATAALRSNRGADYDADAAMEAAVATIRVDPTMGYVGSCPAYSPAFSLNTATAIRVDCFPQVAPLFQRRVVLSVCPNAVAAPCPDTSALVRADVSFYDDQTFGRAVAVQTWSGRP